MFYMVPIEKRLDFHCVPPDLLTYAELEAISRQLANRTTAGQVRKYQWEQVAWQQDAGRGIGGGVGALSREEL